MSSATHVTSAKHQLIQIITDHVSEWNQCGLFLYCQCIVIVSCSYEQWDFVYLFLAFTSTYCGICLTCPPSFWLFSFIISFVLLLFFFHISTYGCQCSYNNPPIRSRLDYLYNHYMIKTFSMRTCRRNPADFSDLSLKAAFFLWVRLFIYPVTEAILTTIE